MTWAKEYKVLTGGKIRFLEKYVNEYLSLGWKCQGGVSKTSKGYTQAMVKQ
jgi:hypothetical protein